MVACIRCLILLALCDGVAAVGVRGVFSGYTHVLTHGECSCGCCIREQRRPNEVNGNVKFKCSRPPASDQRYLQRGCGSQCTTVNDRIFPSSTTLDQNRFCFYHCQPT